MIIETDQAKLERLQAMIDEGIQALDRGEYVEVDDAELDAFLDSLGAADETSGKWQAHGPADRVPAGDPAANARRRADLASHQGSRARANLLLHDVN